MRELAGHKALVGVEPVLIQPALRPARVQDIHRNRQRIGGQLRVNVDMGAVELQLPLGKPVATHRFQGHRLATIARDGLIIGLVIVAPIARPEIAHRQEVEIMVMRQAIDKGRAAAGAHHRLVGGRPQIGAQQTIGARAAQHDRLRAIGIVILRIIVAGFQLVEDDVAQKVAVVAKAAQHPCGILHAFGLARVKADGGQRLVRFLQRHHGSVGHVEIAGHQASSSSAG